MSTPRVHTLVRSFTLASAAVLTMSACGAAKEAVSERIVEEAVGDDVDVEFGNDGEIASIETEDGSLQIGAGADVPDEWPADVPLFEGGAVTASQVGTSNGQTIVSLDYSTDAVVEEAFDGLVATYESAGFATTATSKIGDETSGLWTYTGERNGTTITVSAVSGTDSDSLIVLGVVYPDE